jgi:hypothetical protein
MNTVYQIVSDEVGFFVATPPEQLKPVLPFPAVHIRDLPVAQVQFWRIGVSAPSGNSQHLVVMAHHPLLARATCEQIERLLRATYPGIPISLTHRLDAGYAEISAESHHSEAAASVAEIQRRGNWDDSKVFDVRAGPRRFSVVIRTNGTLAEASVSERAG